MFTVIEYGPDANCFIRQKLSMQGELWKALLRLPLEEGRVMAYVPRDFPSFDLKHFAWPLITADEKHSSSVDLDYMRQTHKFLLNYLKSGPERVAIFRAYGAPPEKKIEFATPLTGFVYQKIHPASKFAQERTDSEVHYFADYHSSEEDVQTIVGQSSAMHPSIVLLTKYSNALPNLTSGQTVTQAQLHSLAAMAEHILMSAYDEDVDLIWSRP